MPELKEPGLFCRVTGKARGGMGRSAVWVQCQCGAKTIAHVWNWAGNGIRRCGGCGSALVYGDLSIVPSPSLRKKIAGESPDLRFPDGKWRPLEEADRIGPAIESADTP